MAYLPNRESATLNLKAGRLLMSAYMIAQIEIADPNEYRNYLAGRPV